MSSGKLCKRRSLALRTRIKDGLNAVLKIAGLQVSTTKLDRLEQARLEKLVAHEHWATAPFHDGLRFEPDKYFNFLQTVCIPYAPYWRSFPRTATEIDKGYFLHNGWFESIDAEVLYSVIRHFRPRTILEIGSGHSSRLARRAIDDGQLGTRLVCVDPSPRVEVRFLADEYIQSAVEDLPPSDLSDRLQANDVLFIDSSHVITTGGDVVYLYLELVPRLRPGILIHVHDIFLPFEYPQEFVVGERWEWTEQYLVQALLMDNQNFEILWASCYMWQTRREEVSKIIAAEKNFPPPSSLWLRKRG